MTLKPLLNKWAIVPGSLVLIALFVCFTPAQQPAPKTDDPVSVNDTYRIQSGDKLSVKLLYHPELNEPSVVVRPDGFITTSLADEVMARELTVEELKDSLEKV